MHTCMDKHNSQFHWSHGGLRMVTGSLGGEREREREREGEMEGGREGIENEMKGKMMEIRSGEQK